MQDDGKENGEEEAAAPAGRAPQHRNICSPSVQAAALRPLSPRRAEVLGVELAEAMAAAAAGSKPAKRTPRAVKSLFQVGCRVLLGAGSAK